MPEAESRRVASPSVGGLAATLGTTFVAMVVGYAAGSVGVGALFLCAAALPVLLIRVPRIGAVVLLGVVVYANLALALSSEGMAATTFKVAQGLSTLAIGAAGVGSACVVLARPHLVARLGANAWLIAAYGLVAIAYAGLGVVSTGVIEVAVYLRYLTVFVLTYLVGLHLGDEIGFDGLGRLVLMVLAPALAIAAVELAAPRLVFANLGVADYLSLKAGHPQDLDRVMDRVDKRFLNLPVFGELRSRRLLGSVLHHVSFAYLLALALILCCVRGRWLAAVGTGALLLVTGAKGPILLVALAFFWRWASAGEPRLARAVVSVSALGVVILYACYGYPSDQHVLGLVAGLRELDAEPLGHGIGIGGNHSELAEQNPRLVMPSWREGYAPFALESAMGVAFYQLGALALLVPALLWRFGIAGLTACAGRPNARQLVPCAGLALLVTMCFQEEALSPYAAGMLMLCVGAVTADHRAADGSEPSPLRRAA